MTTTKTRLPPAARGEGHPKAKLTDGIVLECRRRYRAGAEIAGLAREHGVSPKTMRWALLYGWRHLDEEGVR